MTDQPSAEMQVFAPFAGRTWTGRGPSGEGGDVARWEFILGGRALQVTHRLIGDSYGGRTIIFFEGKTGRYIAHYFTTAGFHPTGEIRPTAEGFESEEDVHGGARHQGEGEGPRGGRSYDLAVLVSAGWRVGGGARLQL